MKTLNSISNTLRTFALCFATICATALTLTAQVKNQRIQIQTIPQGVLQQMAIIDTRTLNFAPQTLGAPLNSSVGNTFKVPADGNITLKVKLDHTGNLPINHTVRIELRDPNGALKASISEYIVKHNEIKTAVLTANASIALSGCGGLNRWTYKVINNDNVNHQATLVNVTIIVPDATTTRTTFPSGGYTLTQNEFGDYVCLTPIGRKGRVRFTVNFAGGDKLDARIFKPGDINANDGNFVAQNIMTASGQIVQYEFATSPITGANQFWTLRLRNKDNTTITVQSVKAEFTDCSE